MKIKRIEFAHEIIDLYTGSLDVLVENEDGQKSLYRMFGKGDPGYKVTSKFAAECALSLLEDPETLPGGLEYGGILTSASGLGNVLIERLKNADIHFEAL